MPCYHPITAYKPRGGGKLLFTANREDADEIQIPCGQCFGCRRKRARHWAIRCVHEARTHKHNCFITLTYNDENLKSRSLVHQDWRQFHNKLLASVHREIESREIQSSPIASSLKIKSEKTSLPSRPLAGSGGTGGRQKHNRAYLYDSRDIKWRIRDASIRPRFMLAPRLHIGFYMTGEYGSRNGRPHFHALLFGLDFADRKFHTMRKGNRIDTSKTLEQLWGKGFVSVGNASFESARYISEYLLKKNLGDGKNTEKVIDENGEIYERRKEYNAMSKRPGIGSSYLHKYGEYLVHGWVIMKGHKESPPRYYDKWMEKHMPDRLEELKHERYLIQDAQKEHHTAERLKAHELVDRAKSRSGRKRPL